jgi:hypothetical protein
MVVCLFFGVIAPVLLAKPDYGSASGVGQVDG